jgi:hypothetical protein
MYHLELTPKSDELIYMYFVFQEGEGSETAIRMESESSVLQQRPNNNTWRSNTRPQQCQLLV